MAKLFQLMLNAVGLLQNVKELVRICIRQVIILMNPERFCVSVVSKIVQNASSSELVPTDHAHRTRAFRGVSL